MNESTMFPHNAYPDKETMCRMKKREIFRLILSRHNMSQAGLSRELGYSKVTVLSLVKELKRDGFIREIKDGKAGPGGGRKPKILGARENGIYLFSIGGPRAGHKLPGTEVSLLNLRGRKKSTGMIEFNGSPEPEELVESVVVEIGRQRENLCLAEPGAKIIAAAFSLGGRVDPVEGKLVASAGRMRKLAGFPLAGTIEERTGIKTYLEDHVVFPAFEEFYLGQAAGRKTFVYLEVLPSVRAIFFLNGFLYRGSGFLAGEIGASLGVMGEGGNEHLCDLFDHGIFGLPVIEDRMKHPFHSDRVYDFKEDLEREVSGEGGETVKKLARLTGQVIVNIICYVDIPFIVLGGVPGPVQEKFRQTLTEEVKRFLYFYRPGDFQVCFRKPSREDDGGMRYACFVADRMFY